MSAVPQVFADLADLAVAQGANSIKDLPGCWETTFPGVDGGEWFIASHGKKGEKIRCSRGGEIPAFTFYVEWNGWPAGFIDAAGGMLAAGGVANEPSLLAAIAKAKEGSDG